MKYRAFFLIMAFASSSVLAQTKNTYHISFENAAHHEASISATFGNLSDSPLEIQMSRTSPGRYAIHNFAKNVYGVQAFDSQGNQLHISRANPQQWVVSGHDGTVVFQYKLFANRGDGTYSQIDETHAHLNSPATFVYARNYMHRPVEITIETRADLNWQVATQLKREDIDTYSAPDTYYLMDSPIEIANYHLREEMLDGQLIRLALHTPANDNEVNEYFTKVMAIVKAQKEIFGELPDFDFGEYTFLSCYTPNASGDGMEHRNSTMVTNRKPLDEPLAETSISTVSHEFFHAWNVERIRPASLEPFNFEEANMSGELWFAEGFTSYYSGLVLVRAGIWTEQEYIGRLAGSINYVYNSPGIKFSNAIEMSYKAPFVDAATSIDPTNNRNTFVSYYTYGSVLGLALDLSLRTQGADLNLDDFFKLVWQTYGKSEIPYSIRDLEELLALYAGEDFATTFFNRYIYHTEMPDFETLFARFGVNFELENSGQAWLGGSIREENDVFKLSTNARIGTPLYVAGLEDTDEIIAIAGKRLEPGDDVSELISSRRPGQSISVIYQRFGEEYNARITLGANPDYKTELMRRPNRSAQQLKMAWLNGD